MDDCHLKLDLKKRKEKRNKTLALPHHHVVGWLVVGGGTVSMSAGTNGQRSSATKLDALSPPF